jgi:hypothetical protein
MGVSQALDKASTKSLGDTYPLFAVLALSVTTGVISGIISLYIGGFLLKHTSRWLGGTADGDRIRAAIAWSSVPVAWALLLWIPQILIFGKDLFTSAAASVVDNIALYFGFLAIELTIAIWAVVLLFKSLGQVSGFSAWRALGACILAALLVAVPLLLLAFAFGAFK